MMDGVMSAAEEWDITFELLNALTWLPATIEEGEMFDSRIRRGYVGFDSVSLQEVAVAPAEMWR